MEKETKNCQNCKNQFTIEPEDFTFYKKIDVPAPTWCSECRLIRRLARRNERSFYKRDCDKCKKPMISVFSPESGLTVYCSQCWWSDEWDAGSYAKEFNPDKPFITQLNELFSEVPVPNLYGLYSTLVNSNYTNMVSYLKNCYMVTYSDFGEDLTYGSFVNHSKDSVDNLMIEQCELCYENINCKNCYQTFFSVDCGGCNNVYFSKNCTDCNDCFGCSNLRSQKYCIFNQPYSKEEYEEKLKDLYPSTHEKIENAKTQSIEYWMKYPQKYMHGWRNTDSSGDYLNDTKNTQSSFVGFDMEDCRFCSFVTGKLTDSYDFSNFGLNSNLLYETLQAGNQISRILMSWFVLNNSLNVEYSFFINGSKNIFGSVGLKKKEYCILNKQYSKEEYDKLREKIIKQMNEMPYSDSKGLSYKYGEFFPIETSPFGYNETTAQEFFPLTKDVARAKGYLWKEPKEKQYQITMKAKDLPSSINEVKDTILNETISCEHEGNCEESCSTAYKIIPQELEFYKRMNLPLPRICPNCRHHRRLRFRNPFKLWNAECGCGGKTSRDSSYANTADHFHGDRPCDNQFKTSYAPDRLEMVYCEKCYNAEVV